MARANELAFLCPKFSHTKLAPTVAVCFAAKELSFEDFCLAILQ